MGLELQAYPPQPNDVHKGVRLAAQKSLFNLFHPLQNEGAGLEDFINASNFSAYIFYIGMGFLNFWSSG